MPFFGGGGGGDYKIVGTNIKGGNLAAPATIGDNNMALGNGALQNLINGDKNIAIGNNAASEAVSIDNNIIIGYDAGSGLTDENDNIVIGHNSYSFGTVINQPTVILGNNVLIQNNDTVSNCVLVGNNIGNTDNINNFDRSIVIGNRAKFEQVSNSVLIGVVGVTGGAYANDSIAIGEFDSDNTSLTGAIRIGSGAFNKFGGLNSIGIGFNSDPSDEAIVIGANTVADAASIVIGNNISSVGAEIVIGDSSNTGIYIGGIDFSGGPGGGSSEGVDAFKITAISTTSTFSFYGAGVTTVGSLNSMTLSNTNVFRKVPMIGAASAAGAGSGCGIYSTQPTNMFPSAASLSGGFKFNCVVSIDDASGAVGDSGRNFFGVSENSGALPNSNPSGGFGGSNTFGIGSDAGDSTLSIIVCDGIGGLLQKTSLGADFPVSASGVPALWEIELTYDVNPITVSYKVTRKTNTNEYVATGVTVPINTPLVAARAFMWRNNGAVASAVRLNINSCSLKII